MTTFTQEQLNFFKFAAVVLDEFPGAIRHALVYMWDSLHGHQPGCQRWDDTTEVRNMFLSKEGTTTRVPTKLSFEKWDCTALLQATLFAKSFSTPYGSGHARNLNDRYVKPRGLSSGAFHAAVQSQFGDTAETFALALDQLRLLRNTLFHQTGTRNIDKTTFDHYIKLAKDACAAIGYDTTRICSIGNLGDEDFPTNRVQQLEEDLRNERDTAARIEQIEETQSEVTNACSEVKTQVQDVKTKVEDTAARIEQIEETQSEVTNACSEVETQVQDVKTEVEDIGLEVKVLKQALQRETTVTAPVSCVPDKRTPFVGRQQECDVILHHLTSGDTRLVDVWGAPGFGKTSVAIEVAHHLRERHIPTYFIPVRGMKSKDELVSKLLSIFTDTKRATHISPSHMVIQCLREFQNPFVLILDNADDLLECEDVQQREEVLRLTEEILGQCNLIRLLFTTRGSLDYLRHGRPIHLVKVEELEEESSATLVRSMLPGIQDDECMRVVKACGQVPLALRLLCSTVNDENVSVIELLDELKDAPLVDVLDNERLPNDSRLKVIINTSFERFTNEEKKSFVSLAVFPGCFGKEEAHGVLGFTKTQRATNRILRSLQQKSFINCHDSQESFTIHSLLQSFIHEKCLNDDEIRDAFRSAQLRFYNYFISSFAADNEKFLKGKSVEAFTAFRRQRESIVLSLVNGARIEELYRNVADALSKADIFLYSVLSGEEVLFDHLFDTAVEEAKKRQNGDDEAVLKAAKAFGHLGWFHSGRQKWDESLQADGITDTVDVPAKLLCYRSVHQLLCGNFDEGVSSLTKIVGRLSSSNNDERILKVLAYHILAVCYTKKQEEETASHYEDLCSMETKSMSPCQALRYLFSIITQLEQHSDLPSIVQQDAMMFVVMAKLLPSLYKVFAIVDVQRKATLMTHSLLRQYEILKGFFEKDILPFEVLESCCDALKTLNCDVEATEGFQMITNFLEKTLGDKKDTARNFDFLGSMYQRLKDYKAAFDCFKRALDIREKLLKGNMDSTHNSNDNMIGDAIGSLLCSLESRVELSGEFQETAGSYSVCDLNDFKPSCEALRGILKLKEKVPGANLLDMAISYDMLGSCQYLMKEYEGAVKSYQQAIKMREETIGDHAHTALSLTKLGCVFFKVNKNMEADNALQSALKLRKKLKIDDQLDTACVYYNLGENVFTMANGKKAVEAHRQALELREKHLGEHVLTAISFDRVGSLYLQMGDYQSAIEPFQNALQLREKLLGNHVDTASSCHSLALTYLKTGSYPEALKLCKQALNIRLDLLPGHEETAATFHLQGSIYSMMGDLVMACEAFLSSLNLRVVLLGVHQDTAMSYHCLGQAQCDMGCYNEALDYLLEACRLRKELLGQHSDTATSLELLAGAYEALGADDLACESLVSACEIRAKLMPEQCVTATSGDSDNPTGS